MKPGCVVTLALCVVVAVFIGLALLPTGPSQTVVDVAYATREAREAERLAIRNQVLADSAGAKTNGLIIAHLGLGLGAAILATGGATLGLWWVWVRSQTIYAHGGMYPLMARPGRRLEAYNPNLLPGADPGVTARAQAVQLAATLQGGAQAHERRAALRDIGGVFIDPAPQLPTLGASPYESSHVERLLLEVGHDTDE